MLFAEDSRNHASPSVLPEKDEAWKMTERSGRRCLELYQFAIRHGSLLKTLVDCLLFRKEWYSSKCVLTWNPEVTKFNRLLFRLLPSTHRTDETECGLLRTPDANCSRGAKSKESAKRKLKAGMPVSLDDQIAHPEVYGLLPTPSVCGNYNKKNSSKKAGNGIATIVRMLPTPQARDFKGSHKTKTRDTLPDQIEMGATKGMTGMKTGLKLQPSFVEWLMGYPIGWTDLKHSETL
jgi:hypothetical protein